MKSTENGKAITLRDGRNLGYAEYGNPDGVPVLFFHGTPGSRLEHHPDQSIAETLGVRMIVPDRPGYGISDIQPGRSILDWADDVQDLMGQLGLEHCAMAGFSGGGPYAAACAIKMPERTTRLGLISSLAPFDNPYGTKGMNEQSQALYDLAVADPTAFEAQIRALITDGEALYQIMAAGLPEADQGAFSLPGMVEMYRADMAEAARQGVTGIVSDMLLIPRDWGFRPEELSCETLLWQGLEDINVPPGMGRYLAVAIPDSKSTFLPGEGHYLLFSHWEEILTKLVV